MAEIRILEKYFDIKKVINIINYENYWRDIRQKAKLIMNYDSFFLSLFIFLFLFTFII